MSAFYDTHRTVSHEEMLDAGRARWKATLIGIIGAGASVDNITPMIDVERGIEFDRFMLMTPRGVSGEAVQIIKACSINASFIADRNVYVDIAHAQYDTRWLRVNWTATQRYMGCLILAAALVFLGCTLGIEYYRTVQ